MCREEFSVIRVFKGDFEVGKVKPPKIIQVCKFCLYNFFLKLCFCLINL